VITPICAKKKILIILEATLGGTRKHIFHLLKGFDKEKFQITFAYSTLRADINFFEELQKLRVSRDIELIEIPMCREIAPLKDIISFLRLSCILWKQKFDLVHCHSSKAGFIGRIATKLMSHGTPTVYTPNSMALNVSRIYKFLEQFAAFFTSIIIAVADSERAEIINNKIIGKELVVTISAGVELETDERSTQLRDELNIPLDAVLVVSVGRLTRQKDPLTFFGMAMEVLRHAPDTRFVWIGDGELREEIDSFIQANQLGSRCFILGWRTDVAKLLKGCDIFALTSLYESFGYVTCEAMACGLPVVATNVTGTMNIVVEGLTGFLVSPQDKNALAQGIMTLVQNESMRILLGERGRERVVKHFSVETMVRSTELLYERLIAKK